MIIFCFYIWQHTVTSARNTGQGFDPNWRGFALRNPCHQMRGSAGHCFCWRACHGWLDPAVCSGPSCATGALEAPVMCTGKSPWSLYFWKCSFPCNQEINFTCNARSKWRGEHSKMKDEISNKSCAETHHAAALQRREPCEMLSNIEQEDWNEDNLTKKAGRLPSSFLLLVT